MWGGMGFVRMCAPDERMEWGRPRAATMGQQCVGKGFC